MRRHVKVENMACAWGVRMDALIADVYHPLDKIALAVVLQAVIDSQSENPEADAPAAREWIYGGGVDVIQALAPDVELREGVME